MTKTFLYCSKNIYFR